MAWVQTDRALTINTPLGPDVLLVLALKGSEGISQLFCFDLELAAENSASVPFDKLLGQTIGIELELPDHTKRYFNGIAARVEQGARGERLTKYRIEMVPAVWLLTRNRQSRIFQQKTVPDIIKQVLSGFNFSMEVMGTFEPRDYCTQYRETDFDFISRLMEEEGIYYYFKHTADGHKMVIANTPQSHADLPQLPKITFEEELGLRGEEDVIFKWTKSQELRSGKVTLWDHCFELPHQHLAAQKTVQDSVQVGRGQVKLKVGNNDSLELYDWPGGYAQRFDGIDKGGGEQPSDVQKIFQDNQRTAGIRMEEETAHALRFQGASYCRQLVSGHKFELQDHYSDNGKYVLAEVRHEATQPLETTESAGEAFRYQNSFTCTPVGVPYRPPRRTLRPTVKGSQTAVVVGPSGEEIFTDKYGRVKVQFHWDREGQSDANSSCWVRVSTQWAGKQWGIISIPRIGHEVVVDFLEGDPDQPIIVGSVYNADQMPPWGLPDNKTVSGIRTRSTKGASNDMLNEIRFEDKKDSELLFIQAQKDMHLRVKNDRLELVDRDRELTVTRDKMEKVGRDSHGETARDTIMKIGRDHHLEIAGKEAVKISGSRSLAVSGDVIEQFQSNHSSEVTQNLYLKAMQIVIEASVGLTLKVGGNFITIDPSGVAISGTPMVQINSAGSALSGAAGALVSPLSPTAPQSPITTLATAATTVTAGAATPAAVITPPAPLSSGRKSPASDAPTHNPAAEENKDKTHWIEIELVDESGSPVAGEPYRITLPDGTVADGTVEEKGRARVEKIDAGNCKVTFPNLDKEAWEVK